VIAYREGMIPPEIRQEIALWRFAFRRGDPGQMVSSEQAIWAHPAPADPGLRTEVEEAMWADREREVLLTPAPKKALLEAISDGWKYRVYGVPIGVADGALVMGFDVVIFSPSGQHHEARAADRDTAFRAALSNAGIAY